MKQKMEENKEVIQHKLLSTSLINSVVLNSAVTSKNNMGLYQSKLIKNIDNTVRIFRKNTKVAAVEKALNIDPNTGISGYILIKDLEEKVGFSLSGNGSSYLRDDANLGLKYILDKQYANGRLLLVRTLGFKISIISNDPTAEIKQLIYVQKCSICPTSTNIECDHKDGRYITVSDKLEDYQPLCGHCNKVKREACKRCIQTGKRYDARERGFFNGWTFGDRYFNITTYGCVGCYLYDVKAFIKDSLKGV